MTVGVFMFLSLFNEGLPPDRLADAEREFGHSYPTRRQLSIPEASPLHMVVKEDRHWGICID